MPVGLDGAAEQHMLPVLPHAGSLPAAPWVFRMLPEPSVRLPVTAASVSLEQSGCCEV